MFEKFVGVYVPGTSNETEPQTQAAHKQAVLDTAAKLSAKFGGATAYNVQGFWMSDVHGLVIDEITIVKSFYDNDVTDAIEYARTIAQGLKDEFHQEAVTVETERGIEFI